MRLNCREARSPNARQRDRPLRPMNIAITGAAAACTGVVTFCSPPISGKSQDREAGLCQREQRDRFFSQKCDSPGTLYRTDVSAAARLRTRAVSVCSRVRARVRRAAPLGELTLLRCTLGEPQSVDGAHRERKTLRNAVVCAVKCRKSCLKNSLFLSREL
jgi:hypothetical protein